MRIRRRFNAEADLDITSFMNLMIILVPVLLLSMVFSHTSILKLNLPPLSDGSSSDEESKLLEVVLRDEHIDVNYPAGLRVRRIEHVEGEPQFKALSLVLQEVKRQLREKGVDKKDVMLLSEPDTSYQTLVSAMDTVRSYQAVVVTSVVEAELFPEVSLGDAPEPAAPEQ
ncbi:ExbD/TolR family protein [Biformimicrobium ophioploci]|uniref:Biopolymer transporter ExbD n=1 Tax=Biformimicrobium ophioploci TaxID=3036711 RepID=A0ABQ6M160_9GAMM|nr:biopolymer transporter ExbD [Microbulbifer sp. NKW57]GMG88091.1 hypothetical protein MNKW57_24120 [Microbulbifer sp. NKW57]